MFAFPLFGPPFWRDCFFECVSSLLRRAAGCKTHSSLVRRIGGSVVDVPRLFSDSASSRVLVRSPADATSRLQTATHHARGAAGRELPISSDWPWSPLAADVCSRSRLAHTRAANRHHCASIYCAFRDESPAAALADPHRASSALSLLCGFKFRFACCAARLSDFG